MMSAFILSGVVANDERQLPEWVCRVHGMQGIFAAYLFFNCILSGQFQMQRTCSLSTCLQCHQC